MSLVHASVRSLLVLFTFGWPIGNSVAPADASGQKSSAGASLPVVRAGWQEDMVEVLPARGPHPSLGDQAKLFDRFVGTWDCDYGFYDEKGNESHSSGELLFGWVLDGHAMQDIWIGYPKVGEERDIGTSLRCFDRSNSTWRVVWMAASRGYLIQLQGGAEGERIVLRGTDTDGSALRWSFEDIRPDSFVWRGESSHDGGRTWWLQEEHHMRRRQPPAR